MALGMAKALGVDPSECSYFDDINTDMKIGINAGMDMVGILQGSRNREELEAFHPKYIIEYPGDILPAIEAVE